MTRFGPLQTQRLLLRPYTAADVDLFHSLIGNPEVMRYFSSTYDRERAEQGLNKVLASYESLGYSILAAERRSDGSFVGHAGLLHWDDVDTADDVEVAYMLHPQYWGQGYATEAARASRNWAFENLGVERVVSFIAVENAPSIAVARRNGMSLVRRIEQNRFGFPIEAYAITRAEWASFDRLSTTT